MNATVATNPTKVVKFILEDEVEGMMAEDVNVLIKAEQNKKKYWMPEDCWKIVKEHILLPEEYIKFVNIRAMKPYYSSIGWGYGTGSEYPDLYRYLRDAQKKGYINPNNKNFYPDFLLVAQSRAKKAKEDLARYLRDNEKKANERSREIKMDLLYGKEPCMIRFRKDRIDYGTKYGWEDMYVSLPARGCESQYKEYLEFMAEVRQYIDV